MKKEIELLRKINELLFLMLFKLILPKNIVFVCIRFKIETRTFLHTSFVKSYLERTFLMSSVLLSQVR